MRRSGQGQQTWWMLLLLGVGCVGGVVALCVFPFHLELGLKVCLRKPQIGNNVKTQKQSSLKFFFKKKQHLQLLFLHSETYLPRT